jgi:hypothetical protein
MGWLLVFAAVTAACNRPIAVPQNVVPGHFWLDADQAEEVFFTKRGGIVIKSASAATISGDYHFADPHTINIELQSGPGKTYKMTWVLAAGDNELTVRCLDDGGYRHKPSGSVTRYRREF